MIKMTDEEDEEDMCHCIVLNCCTKHCMKQGV